MKKKEKSFIFYMLLHNHIFTEKLKDADKNVSYKLLTKLKHVTFRNVVPL